MNITQEQLNTAVQEALKGVLSQGLPAIPDETRKFKDFGNAFMKDKRRRVAKTTYSTYKRIYDKHILPAFENHLLASITRAQVQQFINDMDDEDYSMETMKKQSAFSPPCLSLPSLIGLFLSIPARPLNCQKRQKTGNAHQPWTNTNVYLLHAEVTVSGLRSLSSSLPVSELGRCWRSHGKI